MSKKNQSKNNRTQTTKTPENVKENKSSPASVEVKVDQSNISVKPEHISLTANKHIKEYLKSKNQDCIDKNDLNAVLRLSQHLRVFGLLSAAGYVNQGNQQEGEVRQRTVPVWESLLGQLIDENEPPTRQNLMNNMLEMADKESDKYMATWRRSLILSHHWNFWARAYAKSEDKKGG